MSERSGGGRSRQRRQSGSAAKAEGKPETPATSPGGPESERESSASRSTDDAEQPGNPLAIEQPPPFEPPGEDRARPAEPIAELPEPAPPELIEWTPDRAAALVKAGGLVLHNADPLGHEPGGEQLWRATADDCDAIGSPLARILNRYAPARQLAGFSDEVELTFALGGYAKRNLATRGRLVRQLRAEAAEREPEWPGRGDVAPEDFGPEGPGTLGDTFGEQPPGAEG